MSFFERTYGEITDLDFMNQEINNIILLNPEGDFAGVFRPPFDLSRLSLTYQSVTQN